MYKLVLIRHGESTWNLENRFTGWTDVPLTDTGVAQAKQAGRLLKAEGYDFDVAYTSVLKRAIWTLWHCAGRDGPHLAAGGQRLAPERAPLRRAAGPEQGRHGQAVRRRAGAGLAPQLRHATARAGRRRPARPSAATSATPEAAPDQVPLTECLKDTVARVLPCWNERIAPAIRSGQRW
jgi:2,3-bisphosphoglycerate-dependent phosphoglycerate mutase